MSDKPLSSPSANSPTRPPNVLVFDSGVGGLTIAAEISRHYPTLNLIYLSDTEAFPYGTKSADYLIPRVEKVLTACRNLYTVDMVVIACNTASTVVLPHIRNHFSIPIVGVVPAIKPAAAMSKSGSIGLLATPGTIRRPYTQDLISSYATHCDIVKIGSSRLVQIAEEKLRGNPVNPLELEDILLPFIRPKGNRNIDTVVLACTHFPLLRDELKSVTPEHWAWLDSGEAIARRVGYLLSESGYDLTAPEKNHQIALSTGTITDNQLLLKPVLAQFGFTDFTQLEIPPI